MKGVRADIRLVELGLCESREKARAVIMSGNAFIGGVRIEKPGENVHADCAIAVHSTENLFVSRGGLKLEKAIVKHGISIQGVAAMDVGASTGGFTDCMLRHGAAKVYAIDVGYGQLDWRLRNDERVVVMERTNARFMELSWFNEEIGFASMDVSFISIRLILPQIHTCLGEGGGAVVLVKPQFEAGKGKVGKNGVVRDRATHEQVLADAVRFAQQIGFSIEGMDFSPITGPKGNIEFLLILQKRTDGQLLSDQEIASETSRTVSEAYDFHHDA